MAYNKNKTRVLRDITDDELEAWPDKPAIRKCSKAEVVRK